MPVPRTARRLASLIAAILLIAQLLITTTPVALADPPTGIWSETGPGIVHVVHDGTTGGLAQVDYNYDLGNASGASGTWTFSSTAAADGAIPVQYAWSGLHAWFQAVARLRPFVIPAGGTDPSYDDYLYDKGPTNCCDGEPSNGFTTSGDYTFTVALGDTFGFEFSGSNGDFNSFLRGSLKVGFETLGNGGFEKPTIVPAGFNNYVAPSAAITDWDVTGGSVDHVDSSIWPPYDGAQSLDLDGFSPGTISQSFATIVGQHVRRHVPGLRQSQPGGGRPTRHDRQRGRVDPRYRHASA